MNTGFGFFVHLFRRAQCSDVVSGSVEHARCRCLNIGAEGGDEVLIVEVGFDDVGSEVSHGCHFPAPSVLRCFPL